MLLRQTFKKFSHSATNFLETSVKDSYLTLKAGMPEFKALSSLGQLNVSQIACGFW